MPTSGRPNPSAPAAPPAVADTLRAPTDPAAAEFFEKKIRPVLAEQCFKCHSPQAAKLKGGLRLDNRDSLLAGGDGGPAIIPGDPEKSRLIQAVRYKDQDLQMPPKQKLGNSAIDDLVAWVRMGAPWPGSDAQASAPAAQSSYGANYDRLRKEHWAYRPIAKPETPRPTDERWARNDIDRFVLAQLETAHMKPNEPADKLTLLRRISFDLTGLPPTPAEAQAFVADHSPQAFEKVVDRLLASPAFGERWGRHWLDVARFAESTGMTRNFVFGPAWRYRNWVIDAVNADMPYNEFIKCQIAGDLMPSSGSEQHNSRIIATGFLAIGPRDLNQRNRLQYSLDNADEQIDVVSRGFMATTVACARCHDHKFDPIPQTDYYALAGIFRSTETLCGYTPKAGAADRYDEDLLQRINLEPRPLSPADQARLKTLGPQLAQAQQRLQYLQDQERQATATAMPRRVIFARTQAAREANPALTQRIRDERAAVDKLQGEIRDLTPSPGGNTLVLGARDERFPTDCRLYQHGEVDQPGEIVRRGLPHMWPSSSPPPNWKQSGRLELAQWITSPDNPLTTRVIVNRIWHHLFGAGIVRTVDNFGVMGEKPSNPQLLDYLAIRFADNGWSIKKTIREIVLSQAYQMDSRPSAHNMEIDPENRLIWRMSPRRLEAECIRDAMLAASGSLETTRPFESPAARIAHGEMRGLNAFLMERESNHRAVYLPIIRNALPQMLEVFDFADPSMVMGERETTTVATQALFMMNDAFVIKQSQALASRLLDDSRLSDSLRVEMAYRLALNRGPTSSERFHAASFIDAFYRSSAASNAAGNDRLRASAWAAFCQTLFASAEFRYLN
ncbi:MAG: PSD1 and planctomycete cytochrome C domain-containing protein [Tepidisphaerales bacterium]